MDILMVLGGLALLVVCADWLVKGAVGIGLRLRISPLILGLTVVGFGTSTPELLVTLDAAAAGSPGIALGNVFGSNICNVLLVLGAPALLMAISDKEADTARNYIVMMLITVIVGAMAYTGAMTPLFGIILLGLLAVYLTELGLRAMHSRAPVDLDAEAGHMDWWKLFGLVAVGIAGLMIGAGWLVDGARAIALRAGVSEEAIGLTLVAVGTSLPELATGIAAALRGRADIAFGNVIGSNIFNLLGILGVASLFGPIPVPDVMVVRDLPMVLAASALLTPFVFLRWPLGRVAGLVFLAIYIGYVWITFAA